jgi:uncharacterized protein YcfJ
MSNKPVLAGVAIAAIGIIVAIAIAARYGFANGNNTPEPSGVAAGASTTAAGADAQPAQNQFARVVAVQPVTQDVTTSRPHEVCGMETVTRKEPYKDKHQIGGAVVGGLVGGLLGHQVGGGKGRTLATVGGAAAGAYAGHEIQKKHQENNATYSTQERRCHNVTDKTTTTRTVGYDVTYMLNGRQGQVRMDHDPGVGSGLPVQNGVVVASGQGGTNDQ